MKTRISFGSAVAVFLALALLWVAAAHASPMESSLSINPAGINSLIPNTVYLPMVLSVYTTPCSLAPTLISPANGSTLDTLVPTFTFMKGTAPTTHTVVAIADNPAFNNQSTYWLGGGYIGPNQLTMFWNLEPAITYYWHVYDLCGDEPSPMSATYTFTTGSGGLILPAPTLVSPVDGASGVGKTPTMVWEAVTGAEGYELFVCRLGSCYLYFLTATPTSKVLNSLFPNSTYTWYVIASNHYAYGTESSTWTFMTGNFTASQESNGSTSLEGRNILYQADDGSSYIKGIWWPGIK